MDFKYRLLICILLIICVGQSCSSVLGTCRVQTLFHKEEVINARDLIDKDWDIAYYFSGFDCLSTIRETLNIPYENSDYVDIGRRFIFLSNNRIIHQEIYWDSYYYNSRIPQFNCDTCNSVIVFYPYDRIKIDKKDEIFLLSIIHD